MPDVARSSLLTLLVAAVVLATACASGGDDLTLDQYTETLNASATELRAALDRLDERMQAADASVEDAREVLAEAVEQRRDFDAELEELSPPEALVEFQRAFLEAHERVVDAQAAWAEAANTAISLEELAAGPEAERFRALVSEALATCDALTARLDTAAERQEVGGTPWIPSRMKEVVGLVLDC